MALADIYRLKGDKENCYSSLVMLFNGLANIKNPKDLYALYILQEADVGSLSRITKRL